MSKKVKATGQCLCGAVEVEAKTLDTSVGACHCSMCRRWAGGPFMAASAATEVTFKGEENITRFGSSDWAERGFCRICGTHLFYHLKDGSEYIMAAGLFGDVDGYVFDHQVFIDERPTYYAFANQTKDMTGEELFALYAPKTD